MIFDKNLHVLYGDNSSLSCVFNVYHDVFFAKI